MEEVKYNEVENTNMVKGRPNLSVYRKLCYAFGGM